MGGLVDRIDKNEVLRYLGYKGTPLTPQIESMVDRCISETLEIISPRFLYRRFKIERSENGLFVSGTDAVLSGGDISEHLYNCREMYLMCVTIGGELDRLVRLKMATAPDEGVVYDSCGSAAVEKLADEVENQIKREVQLEGLNTTWRFSPGYGDLPIISQKEILTALDAYRKAGVALTDGMLLTPFKSVTAIVGVTDSARDERKNKCDYCGRRGSCNIRKKGNSC